MFCEVPFAKSGFFIYTPSVELDKKETLTQDKKELKELSTKGELIGFAYEVGSAIAIPLIIFALTGRAIDKAYNSTPLFLIIGLLLSLISTGYIIYKKVKKFI
jgi:F0F1-type ATP synthase assembly protein I